MSVLPPTKGEWIKGVAHWTIARSAFVSVAFTWRLPQALAQPFMYLNALEKTPAVKHDWTAQKLRHVQRWVNRHLWRSVKFEDYDASIKTNPRPGRIDPLPHARAEKE